ncbi:MAG: hypothetical protein LUF91_02640 [Oscillospiraceae bacterium]|nr:hypothetical protein [Oscillospiraceae bacterium]
MMNQKQALAYGRKKGCKYFVRNSCGGLLGGFTTMQAAKDCKERWAKEYQNDPWNSGVTVYIEIGG